MTPADLEQLAALVAAMTGGPLTMHPWAANHRYVVAPGGDIAQCVDPADAAGIVALVNAAPELLRLARVGAAYELAEAERKKQRGVDFPCEECGKTEGNFLDNGWYRCRMCGFPGK